MPLVESSRLVAPPASQWRSVITTSKSSLWASASPLGALLATCTWLPSPMSTCCNAAATASSSSMINILAMRLTLDRQDDAKGGAVPLLGFKDERPIMLVNDLGGNGQTESGAVFFGAEEGIEKPFLNFGRNAGAVVLNFNDDDLGLFTSQHHTVAPRAQNNEAVLTDTLGGILHEIEKDLFELLGIALEGGGDGVFDPQFDGAAFELGAEQIGHLANERLGSHGDKLGIDGLGELEKIFD